MNVVVNPSNADNKGVTFVSSNSGVATVNEKPKKAVYTEDANVSADWCDCDVSSMSSGDMDVRIKIFDSSAPGVVSDVKQVIHWMMPSQGQQVINKLYNASYNGGTLTNIDGRKVVISLQSYGFVIDI